jgi:hypothetical protein
MKRPTITFVVIALLAIGPNAQGRPPESFGTKGAAFAVRDDEVPLEADPPAQSPSGIVWGATPEDYRACDFARAGSPQCPRKITSPSNTRFYTGYYVGGGTPTRGAGRSPEEGTWGWDYSGIFFPKRIALNWTARGRSQGGTGAYTTDGPKLRRE